MNAESAAALELDKRALGKLISLFEDTRAVAIARRQEVLSELEQHAERKARFIGVTGTPGAGKSTLIGELATRLIEQDRALAVAVLAVDPSSHVSGGALLGDRTRARFPLRERRLFFRSQASDRELGGVSRTTFAVCRLLHHLFDIVFIETVGIGQSEIEIQRVADWTYLVLQPLAGDQVQFMKAGIMEIPDAFVLNKCDAADAARVSYHALRASLGLARPGAGPPTPIHQTSATTGLGMETLATDVLAQQAQRPMAAKEEYFFRKWVRDEFGRRGLQALERRGGAAPLLEAGGYDAAQLAFTRSAPTWLADALG